MTRLGAKYETGQHPRSENAAIQAAQAAGEEISITKRGLPVARLVPVRAGDRKRSLGAYGDTIKIADDFDGPLPDEILNAFEGVRSTKPKKP